MNTYEITFIGREIGAIGIFNPIVEIIQSENEENARLKLYEKYEHIRVLGIKEV